MDQGKPYKCGRCGNRWVWPKQESIKVIFQGENHLCPNCGLDNSTKRSDCSKCGEPLTKQCQICDDEFYLAENYCINGHKYEEPGISRKSQLPTYGPPLSEAYVTEIVSSIDQLLALGNSLEQAQSTLTDFEKDPQRIQTVIGIITQMEQQEQTRQRKRTLLSLGVLLFMIIILVAAGFILRKDFLNQNQPGAGNPASQPNLADKILHVNTPVVNYGAVQPDATVGSVITCPRTAQQAAALFGGQPADWFHASGSNAWIMASAGGISNNIRVPIGMKAAYLKLSNNLNLIEVNGPATLSNANYIAISCP
jgi:DNA-directed RNA polymerase subunit RPC12/RpoP